MHTHGREFEDGTKVWVHVNENSLCVDPGRVEILVPEGPIKQDRAILLFLEMPKLGGIDEKGHCCLFDKPVMKIHPNLRIKGIPDSGLDVIADFVVEVMDQYRYCYGKNSKE